MVPSRYFYGPIVQGELLTHPFGGSKVKINWKPMLDVKMEGFRAKFIGWVRQFVENGKVEVMANDMMGKYLTKRGATRRRPNFFHSF